MLDWYFHVFGVENKTSTSLEATTMKSFWNVCYYHLIKITSSKGLTFFFETGLDQGPLASLLSANRRELLQELKLLLCGDLWLGNLNFLQQRSYRTVQGWRSNQLQNAERKAWICLWRWSCIGLWFKGVWEEGESGAHTDATSHPSCPFLVTTCTFLSFSHSLKNKQLFVPNILFSSLIKYGFLCCVVDSSPVTLILSSWPLWLLHLLSLSAVWASRIFMTLWVFCLILCITV